MRVLLFSALLAGCGAAAPPAAPPPAAPPPAAPTTPAEPLANTAPPAPAAPKPESMEDTLVHGHPTVQQFDDLVASFASLSAARRSAIAALGTSADAPIRVPDIAHEYAWVARIACNGAEGQVQSQSLVEQPTELDLLDYTCPGDSGKHATYFDFSADPDEQAMRKQLGISP